MRNRIVRAFAVLSCGCLLLGNCGADQITVETGTVEIKLTEAAAGLSATAAVNFDKVLQKAEEQGLLDVNGQADQMLRMLQETELANMPAEEALAKEEDDASVVVAQKADSEDESALSDDSDNTNKNNENAEADENSDKTVRDNTETDENSDIAVRDNKDSDNKTDSDLNSENSDKDKKAEKNSDTYGYKNIGIANVRTSLNVRDGASIKARRIGSMQPDSACEIKGYEGDWAKIKSGDVTGYVMSSYLLVDEEAQQRADLLMSDSVTVNADVLRVRESASINSRIITRVNSGTKLVLADSEDGSAQNSAVKQEQSGAPPGEESDPAAEVVKNQDNPDDFAVVKVKEPKNIEVAEKSPPDEDAFEEASDVHADEIGDNGWVEIELSNGRLGYVSTDYVEISTELATAAALYAPDPIDEVNPAVNVADVTVSENVTVATETVQDDVSADTGDSGGNNEDSDPGGGASEDDPGIAEAPEAEADGGDADVTDSENTDSSDDGSELTEDEQTDKTDTEESEDSQKSDKDGKKNHKDKTDGDSDAGKETQAQEDSGSVDDTQTDADVPEDTADAVPEESAETAPVAPAGNAGTTDPASFAMQFLGNPYVWGGSSLTNGADCSGFVMSVYANYGIALPHSSAAQANYGTPISAAEAVPGDLFFYGSGTINHVGIYVGNGQIIHASNKRTGIKLSSAYYQAPVRVTRLMN
ncbi:MAG: C40 family peptidase [Lachnospiraceae bacterium]|nr:C40 family peptidase [Lachnospiraceae bacterium]